MRSQITISNPRRKGCCPFRPVRCPAALYYVFSHIRRGTDSGVQSDRLLLACIPPQIHPLPWQFLQCFNFTYRSVYCIGGSPIRCPYPCVSCQLWFATQVDQDPQRTDQRPVYSPINNRKRFFYPSRVPFYRSFPPF